MKNVSNLPSKIYLFQFKSRSVEFIFIDIRTIFQAKKISMKKRNEYFYDSFFIFPNFSFFFSLFISFFACKRIPIYL